MLSPTGWSRHLAPCTQHPRVWPQCPLCQRRAEKSVMASSQRRFSSSFTPKLESQVIDQMQDLTYGHIILLQKDNLLSTNLSIHSHEMVNSNFTFTCNLQHGTVRLLSLVYLCSIIQQIEIMSTKSFRSLFV